MLKEDFTSEQSKVEDFWKFINERHSIYLKRKSGESKPWSDDPIFQEWKFTNVFRELDRGTIALRRMLKTLWKEYGNNIHRMYDEASNMGVGEYHKKEIDRLDKNYLRNQFITCILYRIFNWHGNAKFGPIDNPTAWYKYLKGKLDNGQKIVGDSCLYSYQRECALESYIESCREIVLDADDIILQISVGDGIDSTLKHAWAILQTYNSIGPFTAYEFVCDLRYTDILRNTTDICTWCNISPGAERGLQRMGLGPTLGSVKELWDGSLFEKSMDWVLKHIGTKLKYPYWELKEIESCLHEFDKYEGIRLGQSGPRAKFSGI